MVVAERMEKTVNDETCELFANMSPMTERVRPGDLRSDVDVRDHGTVACRFAEAEGNHVGRPTVAQVLPIERSHRAHAEEGDGHHRLAHPLGIESAPRDLGDTRARQRNPYAVS